MSILLSCITFCDMKMISFFICFIIIIIIIISMILYTFFFYQNARHSWRYPHFWFGISTFFFWNFLFSTHFVSLLLNWFSYLKLWLLHNSFQFWFFKIIFFCFYSFLLLLLDLDCWYVYSYCFLTNFHCSFVLLFKILCYKKKKCFISSGYWMFICMWE